MQKRVIILTILLIVLFSTALTAVAQGVINVELNGNERAEINCDGRRLILRRENRTKVMALCRGNRGDRPTDTPDPEPSDTPVPEPSDTPEPEPTDTPEPTPTEPPTSDGNLCPDHNPEEWHGLYDSGRNCHYNHEHKYAPSEVNDIFGEVGGLYGGQSISYPWHTPNENEIKHEGYGWIVDRDINNSEFCRTSPLCINAFRTQYHAVPSAVGAVTRFHSFWGEAELCRGGQCGIIKMGGWQDFGRLTIGDQNYISLPDQDNLAPIPGGSPRRIHFDEPRPAGGNTTFTWYGSHPIMKIGIHGESWGWITPNDPSQLNLFCPNADCQYNASRIKMHILAITIPSQLDNDDDGIANFEGWLDRSGHIANNCSSPGLDCVPFILENVPVGYYQYRNDSFIDDFDTSPPGEHWIKYPN